MILPLGSDRPLRRATLVNHALIALNVLAFLAMLATRAGEAFAQTGGGMIGSLAMDADWTREPWRLLTYAFLHSPEDWWHILGNMLFLWVFGPQVEDKLGRIGYPIFYLAGAVAAALAHAAMSGGVMLGASGAVAAVSGAFLVLFPRVHIKLFLWFILIGVFHIPAIWFIAFAIARDFLFESFGARDNVARVAHLGGYALGIGVAAFLVAIKVLPREPFDLLSIIAHKRRLNDFRTANQIASERDRKVRPPDRAEQGGLFGKKAAEPEPDRESVRLAEAKSRVNAMLASGDVPGAVGAYRDLIVARPSAGLALLLARMNQLGVANELFKRGDHKAALLAYQLFAEAYAGDPQHAHVRLMIGLLHARYLGNANAARAELSAVMGSLSGEDQELARALIAEIDHQPSPGAGAPG